MGKQAYRLVDVLRKTDAISAFTQLDESQWWSREKLEQLQFERLKKLLIYCGKSVPFYIEQFKTLNFVPEELTKAEDIRVLPILTKDIIISNYESFKSIEFNKYKPRIHRTGGSTGKPLVAYFDFWSHSYMWANNIRAFKASSGYNIGDRFIINAHGSLAPKQSSFKRQVYFYLQNASWISNYHIDEEALIKAWEIINRSKAVFIYGASSSLSLIASFAKKQKIENRSGIKAVVTTSDMLYPNQRQVIEEVFNVPVFDSYGCPEAGIITFECDKHNGYHINMESAYVEIDSKDNNGSGKIISTPLFNYAFPFIRYDSGDVGSVSNEICSCGRGLTQIRNLGGRIRDFVVLRDGRHIHGAFFNRFDSFYTNDWIDEYQIIQKELDYLIIKITPRRIPEVKEQEDLKMEIKKGLLPNLRIEIDLNGVEYTAGGKFRLIISEVKTKWE